MDITPHKNGAAPSTTKTTHTPLVKADAAQLRKIWPRVRLGCLAIKARDKHSDGTNWTPEHIYSQLLLAFQNQGTAELWQIMEGGEMRGFLVTIVGNCPYLNVRQSLLVWIAYTFRPVKFKTAREILNQLEQYTRDCGLKYIDGYSTNFGWIKWLDRMSKNKFRAAQFMFRRDVWKD